MTAAEGGGYSLVIGGGLLVAAACGYAVFKELFVETLDSKVYNKALEEIQQDPRVMVRLGSPIKGYGSESQNRRARQRIKHRLFKQEDGTLHCQLQVRSSSTCSHDARTTLSTTTHTNNPFLCPSFFFSQTRYLSFSHTRC